MIQHGEVRVSYTHGRTELPPGSWAQVRVRLLDNLKMSLAAQAAGAAPSTLSLHRLTMPSR